MCVGRGCAIFAAVWTIMQTATQFSLALPGLMLYNCEINSESTLELLNPVDLIHLSYFWNPSCRDEKILKLFVDSNINTIDIEFEDDTVHTANRTGGILLTYVIMNGVLLVLSIVLLFSICFNSQKIRLFFEIPWIIVASGLLILDIVAAALYITDIFKITNLESWFTEILNMKTINKCPIDLVFHNWVECVHYTGIDVPSPPPGVLPEDYDFPQLDDVDIPVILLQLPSIVFALFCCRFIIVWMFNLCFLIGVISSARKGCNTTGKVHALPTRPPQTLETNVNNRNYDNQRHHQNPVYDRNQRSYQDPFRSPIEPFDNEYGGNSNPVFDHYYENGHVTYNQNENGVIDPYYSYSQKSPTSPPAYSTLNGVDRGGNRFVPPAPLKSNLKRSAPPVPTPQHQEPIKKNILPTAPKPKMPPPIDASRLMNHQINSPRDSNSSAVKNPAELRSQMPWSYFQSRENQPVTAPRRNFSELRDDEELPPVPVPDYTLHFPKRNRATPSPGSTDSFRSQEILY